MEKGDIYLLVYIFCEWRIDIYSLVYTFSEWRMEIYIH